MSHKAIITNKSALKEKYKAAGFKVVEKAIARLVRADRKRGVTSEVFFVDDKTTMEGVGGNPVTNAASPKANKEAIDDICEAHAPDYVLLLGAPDVVPHQPLRNPVRNGGDPDPDVPSDLPYACDNAFSRDPGDFVGPTRVVGRLPGILAVDDPAYLIGLLKTVSGWKCIKRSAYKAYFGVSAAVWKKSSQKSLRKVFGGSSGLQLSPPEDAQWPKSRLAARSHFINCHGDDNEYLFFGEGEDGDMPDAHDSTYLSGKIKSGTVVAAECCYGAQLYDPEFSAEHPPICNKYLAEGAWAFVGSTNIAYGPPDSNGAADYVCQMFLAGVLAGASTGRAMLQARHGFVKKVAPLSPIDLKTLAQFCLLGDPSIHPVTSEPAPKSARALAKARGADRPLRRQVLRSHGRNLMRTTAVAGVGTASALASSKAAKMMKSLGLEGLAKDRAVSLAIPGVKAPGAKMKLKRARAGTCHMIADLSSRSEKNFSRRDQSDFKGKSKGKYAGKSRSSGDNRRKFIMHAIVLIAKELDGKMESVQEFRPR